MRPERSSPLTTSAALRCSLMRAPAGAGARRP
jgi:hypothetical protein